MSNFHENIHFQRFSNKGIETIESGVIVEKAVSLTINGNPWLSFMCTPTQLDALAVGFLFNEKIIDSRKEIADIRICDNNENIDVWLFNEASEPNSWKRTSSCTGGITSVDFEEDMTSNIKDGYHFSPDGINRLVKQLIKSQILYRDYGGVHTSVLADGQNIVTVSEDVGRHNTIDKIAGHCILEDIEVNNPIILTTGRISSEMLHKSARIGAAVIVSRTSPTSMSIQMANSMGITLIGYARGNLFNIYSHPERIKDLRTTLIS